MLPIYVQQFTIFSDSVLHAGALRSIRLLYNLKIYLYSLIQIRDLVRGPREYIICIYSDINLFRRVRIVFSSAAIVKIAQKIKLGR